MSGNELKDQRPATPARLRASMDLHKFVTTVSLTRGANGSVIVGPSPGMAEIYWPFSKARCMAAIRYAFGAFIVEASLKKAYSIIAIRVAKVPK